MCNSSQPNTDWSLNVRHSFIHVDVINTARCIEVDINCSGCFISMYQIYCKFITRWVKFTQNIFRTLVSLIFSSSISQLFPEKDFIIFLRRKLIFPSANDNKLHRDLRCEYILRALSRKYSLLKLLHWKKNISKSIRGIRSSFLRIIFISRK